MNARTGQRQGWAAWAQPSGLAVDSLRLSLDTEAPGGHTCSQGSLQPEQKAEEGEPAESHGVVQRLPAVGVQRGQGKGQERGGGGEGKGA